MLVEVVIPRHRRSPALRGAGVDAMMQTAPAVRQGRAARRKREGGSRLWFGPDASKGGWSDHGDKLGGGALGSTTAMSCSMIHHTSPSMDCRTNTVGAANGPR